VSTLSVHPKKNVLLERKLTSARLKSPRVFLAAGLDPAKRAAGCNGSFSSTLPFAAIGKSFHIAGGFPSEKSMASNTDPGLSSSKQWKIAVVDGSGIPRATMQNVAH
jgi:hypothetical protein